MKFIAIVILLMLFEAVRRSRIFNESQKTGGNIALFVAEAKRAPFAEIYGTFTSADGICGHRLFNGFVALESRWEQHTSNPKKWLRFECKAAAQIEAEFRDKKVHGL